MTWMPKARQIVLHPKPDFVPDWIYTEAVTAKRFYNQDWEFWVWAEAQKYNCSQAVAEDACIRGLQKALHRVKFIYGDKIGKWYVEFLDMGDIFQKVRHPDYLPILDK